MKKILIFLILVFNINALADKLLKVAVIDSGFNFKYSQLAHLCPNEHKDFTGEGLVDLIQHGTNIVGLIVNNAQSSNYCIVLIKAYSTKINKRTFITEALEYAFQIHANIINLSGGGPGENYREKTIVKKLLDNNITLAFAAGNDHQNLDYNCDYYPACYDDRIFIIGSESLSSNYGKVVDTIYDGENKTAFGLTLSGTSMSTAIFTGQLLKSIAFIQKVR